MDDPGDERVVSAAQRAVDAPAERVLDDRYTDFGSAGDELGGGGRGSSAPSNSAFMTGADPGFMVAGSSDPLAKSLAAMTAGKPFSTMRFALVDLTADVSKPVYVGYRDTDQVYLASMGKLAALVAAFHLRESARRTVASMSAKSPNELLTQLARTWAAEIRKSNRAGSGVNNDPPVLSSVLAPTRASASDPWTVDFIKGDDTSFYQHLIMALAFSNNNDAAATIRALGYPYIEGALKAAGLNGRRGFLINADYGNKVWDPSLKVLQAGTAKAVASLYTVIVQDRLAGGGIQQDLFGVIARGLNGDIGPGVNAALPGDDQVSLVVWSKNGYVDPNGPYGDSAIIRRRTLSKKKLQYVAVVLGAKSHDEVQRAAVALDDCILVANGEKAKPPVPPP